MKSTLFDKYGGFDTFSTVVSNFYQKVLDSESLSAYFEKSNIEELISHQTNFISRALGGPDEYEGRDLKSAHLHLGITEENFLEVAELLEESLDESGVESEDIHTIVSIIVSLKSQIVN